MTDSTLINLDRLQEESVRLHKEATDNDKAILAESNSSKYHWWLADEARKAMMIEAARISKETKKFKKGNRVSYRCGIDAQLANGTVSGFRKDKNRGNVIDMVYVETDDGYVTAFYPDELTRIDSV